MAVSRAWGFSHMVSHTSEPAELWIEGISLKSCRHTQHQKCAFLHTRHCSLIHFVLACKINSTGFAFYFTAEKCA